MLFSALGLLTIISSNLLMVFTPHKLITRSPFLSATSLLHWASPGLGPFDNTEECDQLVFVFLPDLVYLPWPPVAPFNFKSKH